MRFQLNSCAVAATQLHPAGCTLWSLSPVRGLHLPDLQLKKPGGKWGLFPVLAGVGGWFMHGGSWLAPCIALRRHRRAYRFVKSCPNFQGVHGVKWGVVVSLGWFVVEALRMALVRSGGMVLFDR